MIKISNTRCPQNHRCPAIDVCPKEAISQKGYSLPVVDMDKCITCKKCISFCPMGAIMEDDSDE